MGALTALQLDLVIAAGERLMHPVGQEALIKTTVSAGLTGLLCWVICALVTRAISRAALRPYNALADHFERLADGDVESPIDLHGSVAGVRRLARAVVIFHQRDLASRRSEASLQVRYDRLYQEHADERCLLMGMLMDRKLEPERNLSGLRSVDGPAPAGFEITDRPAAVTGVANGPAPHTGEVVDLAGRLKVSARSEEARSTETPPAPDHMPLDFVFVRR